jgi:hypothetical protein
MPKPSRRRPTGPADPNSKFRRIPSAAAPVSTAPPATNVRTASYDETDSVVLPQPVDSEGHDYEFSGTWDRWDILPTVSALISFTGPPSANTQPLPANITTTLLVRASKVFYRTAPGAAQGTMSVRVFRWNST